MGEFIKTIPAVLDTSKEWLEDTLSYFDNIKQIDIEYVKTVISVTLKILLQELLLICQIVL